MLKGESHDRGGAVHEYVSRDKGLEAKNIGEIVRNHNTEESDTASVSTTQPSSGTPCYDLDYPVLFFSSMASF